MLSLITPWWIIRPAYQPSTPLSSLPEEAVPLNITFDGLMRLEGYTVTPTQLVPSTPMDLTLYWRAGVVITPNGKSNISSSAVGHP